MLAQVPAQAADGTVTDQSANLEVVDEIALLNGLRFQVRNTPAGAATDVSAAPVGTEDQPKVGDVVVGFLPTSEKIGPDLGIQELITRELDKGTTSFPLAVARDGGIWVVSFDYSN